MAWFSAEAHEFLGELALNNDRDWFHANKKRYEKVLKEPLANFAAEMISRMQAIDPSITSTPKEAVFRIHRDTRFSKNRAPYKENAAMVVAPGGRHEPGAVGLYLTFDANHLMIASGCYFLDPPQLEKIRRHLAAHPGELQRLSDNPEFRRYFGEIQGMKNKKLPPEFSEAAGQEPLLYNKQFFYFAQHPVTEIERDDLPDFVMAHMQACQELNRFLTQPLKA